MNKFDCINKVIVSHLKPEDKCLLVELIMRADDEWKCWPSVARLCKVRGIKHEKNFKGADFYLPGLVRKEKRGKSFVYYVNISALEGVNEADVVRYQGSWAQRNTETPALEGAITPAPAEVTPAMEENAPAVEGVDTTKENTMNSTEETTEAPTAAARADALPAANPPNSEIKEDESPSDLTTTESAAPAGEGVKPSLSEWARKGYRSRDDYATALQREKNLAEWDAIPTPALTRNGVERV